MGGEGDLSLATWVRFLSAQDFYRKSVTVMDAELIKSFGKTRLASAIETA